MNKIYKTSVYYWELEWVIRQFIAYDQFSANACDIISLELSSNDSWGDPFNELKFDDSIATAPSKLSSLLN